MNEFSYQNQIDNSDFETQSGIFYSVDSGNADTVFFADMPVTYRNFFVPYCATCHSNRWRTADERQVLSLNTWDDVIEFGPERLYLTAVSGGMPKKPVDKVPADVLNSVAGFLNSRKDEPQGNLIGSITGMSDPRIEQLTEKYCGGCHGHKGSVLSEYNLSTYERWIEEKLPVQKAIETVGEKISMPYRGTWQKSEWDNNPEEKQIILNWIKEGL